MDEAPWFETDREHAARIVYATQIGQKCKLCGKEYETIDDVKKSVWSGAGWVHDTCWNKLVERRETSMMTGPLLVSTSITICFVMARILYGDLDLRFDLIDATMISVPILMYGIFRGVEEIKETRRAILELLRARVKSGQRKAD